MSKRYSQEFKDRAVRLLSDRLAADRSCSQWRAVNEIAPKLRRANEILKTASAFFAAQLDRPAR